jgi:regulator of RNase E activity RraA
MLEAFAGLSTPLVADACVRCGVPLRAAPAGIRAVVAGQRVAGRVLPARHYGSVDVFLEALGRAGAGDVLVIDNGGRTDGVVFVPAGQAGPVLAAARQIGEVERDQARRIREGQTLRQQTAFDDYLAQRAADPSRTFRQHLRRTGGAIEE